MHSVASYMQTIIMQLYNNNSMQIKIVKVQWWTTFFVNCMHMENRVYKVRHSVAKPHTSATVETIIIDHLKLHKRKAMVQSVGVLLLTVAFVAIHTSASAGICLYTYSHLHFLSLAVVQLCR